jgi:hypothetical protein
MWTDTCHKNDLVHLEAMVIRLEQLLALGDSIAATSLVGQPAYWRGRIGMLLESAGDIENIRFATDQSQGYEEITISFAPTPFESLEAIVDRIKKIPWVADTVLC